MLHALNRANARFGAGLALAVCCAVLFAAGLGGTARADSSDWFCPWNNGSGGFISLGANTGCTSSFYNGLTQVAYYHRDGANVDHCAVSKWTDDPGGSGSNAIPAACGLGAAPYGFIATNYQSTPVWSFARGKNNEGVTHYGFYGLRWWR